MHRFMNILCVVELDTACKPVLERAVTLAESNHAQLCVVSVVERVKPEYDLPGGVSTAAGLQNALVAAARAAVEDLVREFRARIEIRIEILIGTPFLQIIRQVLREQHDLVIKLPEHQDWLDQLFGSDDMHLLRKCPCPTWLIKPQAPKAYRRILAAVDVGDSASPNELETRRALNRQLLDMATSLALADFAELHVVHVWDALGESVLRGAMMSSSEAQIAGYIEQVRQHHAHALDMLMRDITQGLGKEAADYLKPRAHLVKGSARREIPALARRIEADLIVMGTVARTGVPGFVMGNTAETILNQIECSVLAIKPPGFSTPVTLDD